MDSYDVLFTGGGAAALSTAMALAAQQPQLRMGIIDPLEKNKNDRTWCFWTDKEPYHQDIVAKTWKRAQILGDDINLDIDLDPYAYHMVRGIDFYKKADQKLKDAGVVRIPKKVEEVRDSGAEVEVQIEGGVLKASQVLDSRFLPSEFTLDKSKYQFLLQHFWGQVIEVDHDYFDPEAFTMFDFRTSHRDRFSFMYVLPFDKRTALVEYTFFDPNKLQREEYLAGIDRYIADILKLEKHQYRVTEEEDGVIPMTNMPFVRRQSPRILNIGTKGGMVKGSTGYAFYRMQKDAELIASSWEGDRFGSFLQNPTRYRVFDTMLLYIMNHEPVRAVEIFKTLFKNNKIQNVFTFLNEEGGWGNNLGIMASVPPLPFIHGWWKSYVERAV